MKRRVISIFLIATAFYSCKTAVKQNTQTVEVTEIKQEPLTPRKASERAILYRTKGNYYNLVPVELSEDKKSIVSFPDPKNLAIESGYPMPMPFSNNYLLDFAGIGLNVAYLKLTYEEYSKLEKMPNASELYELIKDKDPLYEMCDCGLKSDFSEPIFISMNNMIDSGFVRTRCKILK